MPVAVCGCSDAEIAVAIEQVSSGLFYEPATGHFHPPDTIDPFIPLLRGPVGSLFESVARADIRLDTFPDGHFIIWFFDLSAEDYHCFDSREVDIYGGDYRNPNPRDVAERLLRSTIGDRTLRAVLEEIAKRKGPT